MWLVLNPSDWVHDMKACLMVVAGLIGTIPTIREAMLPNMPLTRRMIPRVALNKFMNVTSFKAWMMLASLPTLRTKYICRSENTKHKHIIVKKCIVEIVSTELPAVH